MPRRKSPPPPDQVAGESTVHVIQRAQQGDRTALRILIERSMPSLKRWARGRLPSYARSSSDTEDVVQDAVLGTLRRVDAFDQRTVGGLQAYLREAVVNRIRDLIRSSRRRGTAVVADEAVDAIEDTGPSPLEQAIVQERLADFLEALQKIKPSDRQVIVWRVELGYSIEEISRRLGKSKPAAAMTVSRAVAKLHAELHRE